MVKAPTIALSLRQKIGRYKDKNPKATIGECAQKFNVTYNQARRAIMQWQSGVLRRSRPKARPKDISELVASHSADELLEMQYHKSIAALESNHNLATDERIKLLESLFAMRKILQALKLENHIKRVDAGIIKLIIKKYAPEVTDDEVIKIYLEAVEKWKLESK